MLHLARRDTSCHRRKNTKTLLESTLEWSKVAEPLQGSCLQRATTPTCPERPSGARVRPHEAARRGARCGKTASHFICVPAGQCSHCSAAPSLGALGAAHGPLPLLGGGGGRAGLPPRGRRAGPASGRGGARAGASLQCARVRPPRGALRRVLPARRRGREVRAARGRVRSCSRAQ